MIIGISGKIGSGKDTAAMLLYKLWMEAGNHGNVVGEEEGCHFEYAKNMSIVDFFEVSANYPLKQPFYIKKLAGKLKQTVALVTGCKVEQLEDQQFKASALPEDWTTINGEPMTYRWMLQQLGTEVCRNIHPDFWVNALLSEYVPYGFTYPTWVISDVRFPNEAEKIKELGGIVIRIDRDSKFQYDNLTDMISDVIKEQHISETALDNYDFDHGVPNNGTIEDLYNQLKNLNLFNT